MKYKRVIFKLSGEALKGETGIFDEMATKKIAEEISTLHQRGIEIGIIIGGGNVIRGRQSKNKKGKKTADKIGMLATVQNALFLQYALKQIGIETRTQTANEMLDYAEKYTDWSAEDYLANKQIVIIACGTGNPGFSTDTAAALRADELRANAILKGTKEKGFYRTYPPKDKGDLIKEISYKEALGLRPADILDLDTLAFLLRRKCEIPIHIFNIFEKGNLLRVAQGEPIGTKIVP